MGASHARVKLRKMLVDLEYSLNQPEHDRRQAVGLGAVTRIDTLDAFMDLPAGLPVSDLSKRARRYLLRAPKGTLEFTLDGVVRRIVPPLTVLSIVVRSKSWAIGSVKAGQFGAYCTRSVLLPRDPEDVDNVLMEADFWGIGVHVGWGKTVRTLLEPEPFVGGRHSPAKWWLAEEAYGQIAPLLSARPVAA